MWGRTNGGAMSSIIPTSRILEAESRAAREVAALSSSPSAARSFNALARLILTSSASGVAAQRRVGTAHRRAQRWAVPTLHASRSFARLSAARAGGHARRVPVEVLGLGQRYDRGG